MPARRATMMPRRPTMRGSTPMPGPATAGMRSGTAIVSKMSTHRSPTMRRTTTMTCPTSTMMRARAFATTTSRRVTRLR